MKVLENDDEDKLVICPVCEKPTKSFLDFGIIKRSDALCPNCGSLERHRLAWLFFERKTNLLIESKKKMLHVAPEKGISKRLENLEYIEYSTCSLNDPTTTLQIDLRRTELPNECFDAIYCSHVLEHIIEDKVAILEINRILKRNGWAVFQVPLSSGKTYENAEIVDSKERELVFGQKDHVRVYGMDFIHKLINNGFSVSYFKASSIITLNESIRYRININNKPSADDIFYCKKL